MGIRRIIHILLLILLVEGCGGAKKTAVPASEPNEPPFSEMFLVNSFALYSIDSDYTLTIHQTKGDKSVYYQMQKTTESIELVPGGGGVPTQTKNVSVIFSVRGQVGVDMKNLVEWQFKRTAKDMQIDKHCDVQCRDSWKISRITDLQTQAVPAPSPAPEPKEERFATLNIESFSALPLDWKFNRKGDEYITVVPPGIKEKVPIWMVEPGKLTSTSRDQVILSFTPDVAQSDAAVQKWILAKDTEGTGYAMHTVDYQQHWSGVYNGMSFVLTGWESDETWTFNNIDRNSGNLPQFKLELVPTADANSAAVFYFLMMHWIKTNRVIDNIDEIIAKSIKK